MRGISGAAAGSPSRRGRPCRGATRTFGVVLALYVVGSVLAWKAFGSEGGPVFIAPSSGVTVAAAILTRRSRWPIIAAAIVLGESTVDLFFGRALPVAVGYSLANGAEPLVGAWLVRVWCSGYPDLRKRRDLAVFIAGACLIGPAVGGLIGGTATELNDGGRWLVHVGHWWIAHGLGVLVVGTPVLLWTKQSAIVRFRAWETAVLVVLTAGVSGAAFLMATRPSTLILPILAWAALRLDMLGAALAGGAVGLVAGFTASRAHSFVNQFFVVVAVIVALLVAQEASARVQAVRERELERRERVQLQGLSQLAQQLSAALTPEDIGRALKKHVIKEVGAQGVSLGLLSPEGHLVWVAAPGYPQRVQRKFNPRSNLDEPLLGTDVVRAGQAVMIRSQAEYEARYGASVRWLRMGDTHSIAGWPLTGGGQPFGALIVIWGEEQQFDAVQVAYMSAVTTLVSQALVRARIYVDEHARAAVLQSALVPDSPGDTGGLDVYVAYEPAEVAEGLGGDWYDVMALPKDRMYFSVGDVIGHGLPAVEDMAQLRTAGRTLAHLGLPPAQLLAELNAFARHASQRKFATMAVAVFDSTSGELTYCSAGHPPPLLRRGATGEVLRLSDTSGAVLGPLAETSYVGGSLTVLPDDVLVMYTDGLVERRGVDVESGISTAEEMIAAWTVDSDLGANCEALHETLSPQPRGDDVCLIAIRFP